MPPDGIADKQIESAIRERIARAADIPAALVQVSVQNGIATLQGEVNRGVERERTSEIAERTRGVRAVVNRLTIKVTDRTDQALERDVHDFLQSESPRAYANVRVSAEGHRVTLAGSVPQAASKEAAERLAWYVPGVAEVENALAVVPGYARADAEIQAEVKRNLRVDPYIANAPLQVSVQNGSVHLSGTVASAFEKRRARNSAEVAGVVEVRDDEVRVQPQLREAERYVPATVDDAETRAAIRDAFAADPRVPRETLDFDVKYGVVTLTGVVASLEEKLAAGEDARRALGVSAVVNQLQVRPWAEAGAGSVERRVLDRLRQHPYVDARRLRVRTDRNAIVLDGSVGSQFERTTAERVAAGVPGVPEVSNQLTVAGAHPNYRSDDEIRTEVKRALYWDRRVGDANIAVNVAAGTVTIRGEVNSPEVYDAVLQDVFELAPRGVVNELTLPARQRPQAH